VREWRLTHDSATIGKRGLRSSSEDKWTSIVDSRRAVRRHSSDGATSHTREVGGESCQARRSDEVTALVRALLSYKHGCQRCDDEEP